ncbi:MULTISPECIES: hypothetical protein [Rhodococcus]|uniref:putative phage holin n=1 Tax=Rhodococcus TaxID=1827 RepID=UPI00143E1796|nr:MULTISPECIES: hypothetical protein [Rhodococcus]QIX48949.1 hypothetical protein HFP48_04845 [Rhodococcus sp. DMU1]QRI76000.1 hypothetical protein JQ505_26585 [Rhodococcus aetherivorans]QSE59411.1 hypothetical protein JYA75_27685 [Rhodococcus sp. PSBB066]QSE69264.1 hypothetical protein JYA91_27770 [Rhodococcus sp. PSBB049]USC16237.1 hypothetical protein KZJ41_04760 [Rhodococcus sp. 11-3]
MIRTSIAIAALLGIGAIIVLEPEPEARLLVTAMTILAWMFALSYAVRSHWRITQAGRSVMATTVCLALLGTQLMSRWWFGPYPGHHEVRAVILLALVLTILHRLLVLWRIQREGRPMEQSEDAR